MICDKDGSDGKGEDERAECQRYCHLSEEPGYTGAPGRNVRVGIDRYAALTEDAEDGMEWYTCWVGRLGQ